MSLNELYNAGVIKMLTRKGLISVNSLAYFQYYQAVKDNMQKGMNKTQAVKHASDDCKVSEVTIWKAFKMINEED